MTVNWIWLLCIVVFILVVMFECCYLRLRQVKKERATIQEELFVRCDEYIRMWNCFWYARMLLNSEDATKLAKYVEEETEKTGGNVQ